ncbi:hypothetical protein EDD18DRAFT_1069416, partial [Armillaria luteobubalina]
CDSVDMHDIPKAPGEVRSSWSHAQKLRAGITWGFRTTGRRGTECWSDQATGNPSVSDLVSSYMVSLRRRESVSQTSALKLFLMNTQAALGKTPTSSRAVTPVSVDTLI